MKILATFKCPDYWAQNPAGEEATVPDNLKKKFFEWNEYVTIELDTKTLSAKVVEV